MPSLKYLITRSSLYLRIRKTALYKKIYKLIYYPRVVVRSEWENVYYCCVQKTASQWVRKLLADPIVYKHSGLEIEPYEELGLKEARIEKAFPKKRFVTHLYIDYDTYLSIPKPEKYTVFFVTRDPRDAVVSWYFSAKFSHIPVYPMNEMRPKLEGMDRDEGMRFVIDKIADFGFFEAQRSWSKSGEKIFRYEDLASNHADFISDLLDYLNIEIPETDMENLRENYRFEKFSGRKKGEENKNSHYRKGESGDWKNHMSDEVYDYFKEKTGDLVSDLGYEW